MAHFIQNHCLRQILVAILAITTLSSASAWETDRQLVHAQRWGTSGLENLRALQATVRQASTEKEASRLDNINRFVNLHIHYGDDIDVWGVDNFWASPVDAIGNGRGNCKEYAFVKYFSLIAAGTPVNQLRLVYVRASIDTTRGRQVAHMILAYYPAPDREPLILDNLISEIKPASQRPDLTPIFSFNTNGLWSGLQGNSSGDPVLKLSKWRHIIEQAKAEGSF
ncbi:MAG: transglutaminase-like cysteine peptidase [Leptothrix sp. (in: b-proteobacteria)]